MLGTHPVQPVTWIHTYKFIRAQHTMSTEWLNKQACIPLYSVHLLVRTTANLAEDTHKPLHVQGSSDYPLHSFDLYSCRH